MAHTHHQNPPTKSVGSIAFPPSHLGELIIDIQPRAYEIWRGSSAQLAAEGLIPAGFQWPAGFNHVGWNQGEFEFHLWRIKPDGAKGRRNLWEDVDYWFLRRGSIKNRYDGLLAHRVEVKAAELRALLWRQTPEGCQQANRWSQAYGDKSFQNFMAGVLGRDLHASRGKFSFTALCRQENGHD
jgi:hypothetical protein